MTDKKKIAIVDDDEFLLNMFATKLQKEGYSVITYESGVQAFNDIPEKDFDLILLDIMIPDMDGISVLHKLKENENTKNVPVILLTNLDDGELKKKGAEGGALYFLNKAEHPPKDVVEIINEVLD